MPGYGTGRPVWLIQMAFPGETVYFLTTRGGRQGRWLGLNVIVRTVSAYRLDLPLAALRQVS